MACVVHGLLLMWSELYELLDLLLIFSLLNIDANLCREKHTPEAACKTGHFTFNCGVLYDIERLCRI